jgi:hypothetical protein
MAASADARRLDAVASNNLNSTVIVQLGLGIISASQYQIQLPTNKPEPNQDEFKNTYQGQAEERIWSTIPIMEFEEHSQSPAPAAAGDSKSHNVPITNEDLKIMRGIVDYISDYKDLESVLWI